MQNFNQFFQTNVHSLYTIVHMFAQLHTTLFSNNTKLYKTLHHFTKQYLHILTKKLYNKLYKLYITSHNLLHNFTTTIHTCAKHNHTFTIHNSANLHNTLQLSSELYTTIPKFWQVFKKLYKTFTNMYNTVQQFTTLHATLQQQNYPHLCKT